MREFRLTPDRLIAGRALVFRAVNAGHRRHQLTLVRVPDDLAGKLGEHLKGDERRGVRPVALIAPLRPGRAGFFAVDLKPGPYALVCLLGDGGGKSYAARGMYLEFAVR